MRPLLALFIRSLRQDARGASTYVLRGVLVGLALFGIFITNSSVGWLGAPGRKFLGLMLWINLWLFVVVGLSYFASAITEEKEDETLGLLRMTNLSALAILLGKFGGRLNGALGLIAVQLPFLLVAVTMGGVRVSQVVAGFAWLLSFAFLLANVGLLASVICRRTAGAAVLGGLFALPLIFGPWKFFAWWWPQVFGIGPGDTALVARVFDVWSDCAATHRLSVILGTDFSGPVIDWHFAASVAVGIACFLLAWVLFDACAGRATPESQGKIATVTGTARCVRARRAAVTWRDFRFLHGGVVGMVVKALLTGLVVAPWVLIPTTYWGPNQFSFRLYFCSFFVGTLILLILAFDASRIFKHERREHTLSSLATLPLSASQIVWQKARGSLLSSWVPLLTAGICAVLLVFELLREVAKHPPDGGDLATGAFGCAFALFTALLLPVFVAWLSLRLRWGAFPVGTVIWFFANWITGVLCMLLTREASPVVLAVIAFLGLGGFASAIPRRLEELAAEG